MDDILISNTLAILPGAKSPEGRRCSVAVKDGRIRAILPPEARVEAVTVIDGEKFLLTPGLVNAHTHAYMTGMRCWADDLQFDDWLFGRVMPKEDALTPEDAYRFSLLGCMEMLSGGVTAYRAEGDYDEYDIYGGLRLWYADEDLQWLKVTSTLGVGVDYGDFDYQMSATGPNNLSLRRSVGTDDWDIYGLLGLGIMVNFWDFDVSMDALWRFGQNSLKVESPCVNGEIERPDFIFRASLGYNF